MLLATSTVHEVSSAIEVNNLWFCKLHCMIPNNNIMLATDVSYQCTRFACNVTVKLFKSASMHVFYSESHAPTSVTEVHNLAILHAGA